MPEPVTSSVMYWYRSGSRTCYLLCGVLLEMVIKHIICFMRSVYRSSSGLVSQRIGFTSFACKPHNFLPCLNPDWFYLSGTRDARMFKRLAN